MTSSGCPCLYVEPCNPRCTCVNGSSSVGCGRCARYGSLEQRRRKATRLAALEARASHGAKAIEAIRMSGHERVLSTMKEPEWHQEGCNRWVTQCFINAEIVSGWQTRAALTDEYVECSPSCAAAREVLSLIDSQEKPEADQQEETT